MYDNLIIILLCAIGLVYFFYKNENRKIERYYFKHNKYLYALLAFINFILIIAIIANSRNIVMTLAKRSLAHLSK